MLSFFYDAITEINNGCYDEHDADHERYEALLIGHKLFHLELIIT